MPKDSSVLTVREIMEEFGERTGLTPVGRPPRRYLWTDAFAVCNFLELYRQTKEARYQELARRLVDQVHHTLGRHRDDDSRTGWISGLDEREGRLHPTLGGLRIGKPQNERSPDDPFDERLEWDRDGQYYHYLTKWMHALNRVSCITQEPKYQIWAMELAKATHAGFSYVPQAGGRKRMHWKMSIDLSRPLVPAMGQHDPLDGYVTFCQLQATAVRDFPQSPSPGLGCEIKELFEMLDAKSLATADPLGIGGLLIDALRIAQLMASGAHKQTGLLGAVLDSAVDGLDAFSKEESLTLHTAYRLAFRELGLAIGLKAVQKLEELIEENSAPFDRASGMNRRVTALRGYAPLGEIIETFWVDGKNRKAPSWAEHRDINMVMLATCLAPDTFLAI